MTDTILVALGSFLVGALVGGAGVRYQGRADRRDAERFRRETAELTRAEVTAESDYHGHAIILHNAGPADAFAVEVTHTSCGPRSRVGDVRELQRWPLPADIPTETHFPLRVITPEHVGDYIDLTIEWNEKGGRRRRRQQRIIWAG